MKKLGHPPTEKEWEMFDEMVRRFAENCAAGDWGLAERAARYVLTMGPLKYLDHGGALDPRER